MSLIKSIINKYRASKRLSTDTLYYGVIFDSSDKSDLDTQQFVVMQRLTDRERSSYLKSRFHTFLDSEKCELNKYLYLKNSDIQFYRIPSMNNKIVAETTNMDDMLLLAPCAITLNTISLYKDFNIRDSHISLPTICKMEQILNANQQQTYYYSNTCQMLEY